MVNTDLNLAESALACRKHEPVAAIVVPTELPEADRLSFILSSGDRWVRCGAYTDGRQRGGRRRPRWCRSPEGETYAAWRVAELPASVEERRAAHAAANPV